MQKKGIGEVSKLHSIYPNIFHQSAQEKKYFAYTCSDTQDENLIKNIKDEILLLQLPKKDLHQINIIFFLSDPSILFLDELVDIILHPLTKNDTDKMKKCIRYMKGHQRNLYCAIRKKKSQNQGNDMQ